MRKLKLLLCAGTMAGALGGAAYAVEFPPSDGSTPTGPLQSPTGVGMVTTTSGFQEVGSPYTGGEGQQYTPGASSYNLSPFSTPAPGTAILRIDLQAVMAVEGGWWTGMNGSGVTNSSTLNGAPIAASGNKQAPYAIVGYVRLDAGLDGMSKSGIRYGFFTEIRENTLNPNSTDGSAGASTASAGVNTASSTSSGTSSFNGQQTLYVRYAWVYAGTDQLGLITLGQQGGADTRMETGLNDEFDFGGWIQWQAAGFTPAATGPTWPWADGGNNYTAARIDYLSPVIAGFDGVLSFAPNNVPATSAGDTCSSVYTGCISQSTSNAAYDLARWRNELEVGIRYRNVFGPIGVAASGIYTVSAPTQPGPSAPLGAVGTPAGANNALRYNGLNIGIIGGEVTIAKYLSIGGNVMLGAYNGSWGMQSKGGYCLSATVCQDNTTQSIAWVAGARYTIPQLPATVGGSFFDYKYQGQPGLPTQRTSAGLDLGATYGIGPGAVLVAEYLWGYNYQGGFNFLTGAATGTTAGNNNKVSEQLVVAGLALRF
jgi:hypothetical protein